MSNKTEITSVKIYSYPEGDELSVIYCEGNNIQIIINDESPIIMNDYHFLEMIAQWRNNTETAKDAPEYFVTDYLVAK